MLLGTESFPTTPEGNGRLEAWLCGFGSVDAVGVEGTGAWGAGIARHLTAAGHRVVEVDRPDRKTRYRKGKSDTIDAEAAARAVQAGTATGTPKARTGLVESIRALRVARRSAVKDRTAASHQLNSLVSTAPDELRSQLRSLPLRQLVAVCAALRPGDLTDPVQAPGSSSPPPATTPTDSSAPPRSPTSAASHPSPSPLDGHRPTGSTAAATGPPTPPSTASRSAGSAGTRTHAPTSTRKIKEGKTKKAAIRCLKHDIAREIYSDLRQITP